MDKNKNRWTLADFKQHQRTEIERDAQAENSKFGNIWTTVDGINFQSKKEADYYGKLKIRVRSGDLKSFELQKVYKLKVNGVLVCRYVADFVLYYPDGRIEVVDVKSEATKTAVYKIKKALMHALFQITILER